MSFTTADVLLHVTLATEGTAQLYYRWNHRYGNKYTCVLPIYRVIKRTGCCLIEKKKKVFSILDEKKYRSVKTNRLSRGSQPF